MGEHALTLWWFRDGKPGHEHQVEGLLKALARRIRLDTHQPDLVSPAAVLRSWWRRRQPRWAALPAADVVIGAGHATHLSILLAGRVVHARTVVLMKPSLPLAWFDLAILPRHDGVTGANVFLTDGALNHIRPADGPRQGANVILLGGPAVNYAWDFDGLQRQIEALLTADDAAPWQVIASRRTPEQDLQALRRFANGRVEVVAWQSVGRDWLPRVLAQAPIAWITEDSVSMVYEALTAGAACGLLRLPRKRLSRVARGMDDLIARRYVTPFAAWRDGQPLRPAPGVFNEAERCAEWMVSHWLERG